MPPSYALLGRFSIGAWVELLWQHYRNAWQSPAVIRQAHRMHAAHVHYACRRRLPSCCVCCSISSILRGVVMRTRNFSEYMLVLALCLVLSMLAYSRLGRTCYETSFGGQPASVNVDHSLTNLNSFIGSLSNLLAILNVCNILGEFRRQPAPTFTVQLWPFIFRC